MGERADGDFPGCHWDDLLAAMEGAGPGGVFAFIERFGGNGQRRALYDFAQQASGEREWQGKQLDAVMALGQAAVADNRHRPCEPRAGERRRR